MQEFVILVTENLSFLLTCLLVFAGLVLLAWVAEKLTKADLRRPGPTKYTAFVAMFAALSGVLMCFEIPLFFAPSFYKLDLSEVPVMICSFYLGPVAGVVTELLKVVIKILLKGTTTAFVGDFANFVVGCTFVLPAAILYHIRKSKKSAAIGMVLGALSMTIFGSAFNAVYLIPKFSQLFELPIDAIVDMGHKVNPAINSINTLVLMAVVPFNLVKGVVVTLLTFLLYKRVGRALERLLRQP